jgi:hypothetical protein
MSGDGLTAVPALRPLRVDRARMRVPEVPGMPIAALRFITSVRSVVGVSGNAVVTRLVTDNRGQAVTARHTASTRPPLRPHEH